MVPPPPTPTAGPTGRRRPPHHPPRSSHGHPPPAPGDRPHAQPHPSSTASLGLVGPSTDALAMLPEVLTAREAAAILRVGRNQLYQAIARGQLRAVRIGRSIRIPKQALLDLLAAASAPPASDE